MRPSGGIKQVHLVYIWRLFLVRWQEVAEFWVTHRWFTIISYCISDLRNLVVRKYCISHCTCYGVLHILLQIFYPRLIASEICPNCM
jgi:hypothetical protein